MYWLIERMAIIDQLINTLFDTHDGHYIGDDSGGTKWKTYYLNIYIIYVKSFVWYIVRYTGRLDIKNVNIQYVLYLWSQQYTTYLPTRFFS